MHQPKSAEKIEEEQQVDILLISLLSVGGFGVLVAGCLVCHRRRLYFRENPDEKDNLFGVAKVICLALAFPFVIGAMCLELCGKTARKKYTGNADDISDVGAGDDIGLDGSTTGGAAGGNKREYEPWVGADVVLRNLGKVEYNGLHGRIINHLEDKDRYYYFLIFCGKVIFGVFIKREMMFGNFCVKYFGLARYKFCDSYCRAFSKKKNYTTALFEPFHHRKIIQLSTNE